MGYFEDIMEKFEDPIVFLTWMFSPIVLLLFPSLLPFPLQRHHIWHLSPTCLGLESSLFLLRLWSLFCETDKHWVSSLCLCSGAGSSDLSLYWGGTLTIWMGSTQWALSLIGPRLLLHVTWTYPGIEGFLFNDIWNLEGRWILGT